MYNKITISIIIPVYNKEKYLEKAVNSVLQQMNRRMEIIIVDDGSTDNSPQIIDMLSEKYDSITAIHQKNQWVYASFNNGVKAANGEYVYILNSDDCLFDGILTLLEEKTVQYNKPDVIWTKCVTCHCDENQNIIKTNKAKRDKMIPEEKYYSNVEEVRKHWSDFDKAKVTFAQCNLYKRDLVLAHPFRNDVYGADQLFNIALAPYITSAVILPNDAYEYHIYESTASNVSVGGFYSYSHDMWNELYINRVNVYRQWNIYTTENQNYLKDIRCIQITGEIREMLSNKCPWTLEEKLNCIFYKYKEDTVIADLINLDREQVEARMLSGVRELLLTGTLDNNSKMYFSYVLLDNLLRYEKGKKEMKEIEDAINNEFNPLKLGLTFFEKLNR